MQTIDCMSEDLVCFDKVFDAIDRINTKMNETNDILKLENFGGFMDTYIRKSLYKRLIDDGDFVTDRDGIGNVIEKAANKCIEFHKVTEALFSIESLVDGAITSIYEGPIIVEVGYGGLYTDKIRQRFSSRRQTIVL